MCDSCHTYINDFISKDKFTEQNISSFLINIKSDISKHENSPRDYEEYMELTRTKSVIELLYKWNILDSCVMELCKFSNQNIKDIDKNATDYTGIINIINKITNKNETESDCIGILKLVEEIVQMSKDQIDKEYINELITKLIAKQNNYKARAESSACDNDSLKNLIKNITSYTK